MKKYLVLILFTISLFSFGQEGFETLDGDDFSISYPGTWEVNQSGQMGMTFALFSPVKFEGDQFRENINLISQDISSYNMDLTAFVNLSENQIKTMIQDGTILKSEKTKDYHKIIYTGTMGQFKLKFQQHYWVNNGNAYVLTFTSEQTEFDNYQGIAQQIMDGFVIK